MLCSRYAKSTLHHLKNLVTTRVNDGTRCPACPQVSFVAQRANFFCVRSRIIEEQIPWGEWNEFFHVRCVVGDRAKRVRHSLGLHNWKSGMFVYIYVCGVHMSFGLLILAFLCSLRRWPRPQFSPNRILFFLSIFAVTSILYHFVIGCVWYIWVFVDVGKS